MRKQIQYSLVIGVAMLAAALAPTLQAGPWDKKTTLTVKEPIEVPGAVLQPGKYVMRLVDSESNRHVVRFMNEEENEVISTVIAIPNTRLQPTGETEFAWYETPANEPPAMRAWFFPGDNFGQEFVYDEKRAQTLAATSNRNVMSVSAQDSEQLSAASQPADPPPTIYRSTDIQVARPDNTRDSDLEQSAADNQRLDQTEPTTRQAQVVSETEPSDETLMAQNRGPAEAPETRTTSSATELPETAGIATLLGVVGLASLAGTFGIGMIRRRR